MNLLPLAEDSQSSPALLSNQNEKSQSARANRYASLTDVKLLEDGHDLDVTMQRKSATGDSRSTKNAERVLRDDEFGEYIDLSLFVYVRHCHLSSFCMALTLEAT